ncbi:FtsW/RodA/SpoVE family cell cycle protein [Enterococcus sp. BWR-S5]|uniref:FtsW/RodA/SpoVE family cell cycle protein n=1 Tax=Enterococcus sp. BWR-S5 TaxID=2787714 RepID=UPI00192507D3|nr:FtsW/RodA/SpoVE family cell cycle protein [Enterococcus sp. BWR-S5]MBL1226049.1 FtsW/RodA/SpoVE family cell cycle protein [Enterococcus sp. BWR-S5]
MEREKNEWMNYALLLPVFLLVLVGFVAQYGAFEADPAIIDSGPLLWKQILWTVLGVVSMLVMLCIPLRFLWKATPFIYGGSLVLMMLLLRFYDPVMASVTNTRRWLRLGPLTFQPSEFMKIGYILMLALIITTDRRKIDDTETVMKADLKLLSKMLAVSLPVWLLMFYQKDFGTSLVFLSIFAGMLVVSGCSWKILGTGFGVLSVLGASAILMILTEQGQKLLKLLHFQPYQFQRVEVWLHPFEYADGIGYQQARGLTAIGSGGLFGKGLTELEVYVPVRESDMIFTVIGEAFGFFGATLLLLLFFYLIYQMLICTMQANKEFYAYVTTGVVMYFLFHIIENIGAAVGLLPLTGIPLPFLSQGGTAYLANFIAVGLVLSMYDQRKWLSRFSVFEKSTEPERQRK